MDNKQPIKLFYSYSHEDEELRNELEKHLKILQREHYIETWHDRKITAGEEFKQQIDVNLENAAIILLLISSDFIASEYCYDIEMQKALSMHDRDEAIVIPIILRDCLWQGIASFSKLLALPTDGKAITGETWHSKDKAFTETAKQLKQKIEELWHKKESVKQEIIIDSLAYKTKKPLQIRLRDIPVVKKYFTGRKDEIEKLEDAFNNNPFILIEGAGGIGKTQLVARFIADKGIKKKTVWFVCTPTSQPDDIIRGAGFEEILKGENKPEREKFSAFKDKIEEHDLIVFLDNYHEVERKENFKSFLWFINEYLSKGHVIIIGRDNIAGLSSVQPKRLHIIGLGNDSLPHARGLINHLYPDTAVPDEVLQKICTSLHGHPLAIDLAMNLLSQNTPPEQIIQVAIEQANAGNDTIEEMVERLLNEIFTRQDATEDEKNFLKLFSVFRGKIEANAVRAVIPNFIFDNASQSLKHRNILNIQDGYYELHPLIREFCYEMLDQKEQTNISAGAYYKTLRTKKLNPELEEKIYSYLSKAKQWEEIGETIIYAGRDFILFGYLDQLNQMIEDVKKQGISRDVFNIFEGDIAEIKGNWKDAITFFEHAEKSDDEKIRIEGTIKHGEMIYRIGHIKDAKVTYEQAILDTEGDAELREWYARAMNDLGLIYLAIEQYKEALKPLNIALSIREELNNRSDIATTIYNIAVIKRNLNQNDEALEFVDKSLKITEEIVHKDLIAKGLNEKGIILHSLGKNIEARLCFEKSFAISTEIGAKADSEAPLGGIAHLLFDEGKYETALKYFETGYRICEELGKVSGIATALNNIASTLIRLDTEIDKACMYLLRSIALTKEIGANKNILNQLNWLSQIKLKRGTTVYRQMIKDAHNKLDDNLKKNISIREILGEPRKAEPKIGRNDPCFCGSGKKYKTCHGKG